MIELFLDSPMELQLLILGVLILIGKEMFK